MESVYLYLLEWLCGDVMKPTLKHAERRKRREAEDEPLYKSSIFLCSFLWLKICYISSILNVKRRSDRKLKITQYIRYQNKTNIYLLSQKRPELAYPAPRFLWLGSLCPTVWLIVPYRRGGGGGGYNELFWNFSAITFLICLKRFCNIYCKYIVCPKVYIKRLCMAFPITPSWKNYQSSQKKCVLLYPTLHYNVMKI